MDTIYILAIIVIIWVLLKKSVEKFSSTQYGVPMGRERLSKEYNLEGFTEEDYNKFRKFAWQRTGLLQKTSVDDLEGTELDKYMGEASKEIFKDLNFEDQTDNNFNEFNWERWDKNKKGWFKNDEPKLYTYENKVFAD